VNFSSDSDSDGWPDSEEIRCNSDPTNNSARPPDTDGDSICNRFDWDDDGDGFPDTIDRFPQDDSEWRDDDRDGIGKNSEVFEISPGMRNSAFTVSILFTLLIIEFISIREGYNLQDSLPNIFHGEE
jgi:hypothetical protein